MPPLQYFNAKAFGRWAKKWWGLKPQLDWKKWRQSIIKLSRPKAKVRTVLLKMLCSAYGNLGCSRNNFSLLWLTFQGANFKDFEESWRSIQVRQRVEHWHQSQIQIAEARVRWSWWAIARNVGTRRAIFEGLPFHPLQAVLQVWRFNQAAFWPLFKGFKRLCSQVERIGFNQHQKRTKPICF